MLKSWKVTSLDLKVITLAQCDPRSIGNSFDTTGVGFVILPPFLLTVLSYHRHFFLPSCHNYYRHFFLPSGHITAISAPSCHITAISSYCLVILPSFLSTVETTLLSFLWCYRSHYFDTTVADLFISPPPVHFTLSSALLWYCPSSISWYNQRPSFDIARGHPFILSAALLCYCLRPSFDVAVNASLKLPTSFPVLLQSRQSYRHSRKSRRHSRQRCTEWPALSSVRHAIASICWPRTCEKANYRFVKWPRRRWIIKKSSLSVSEINN